MKTKLIALVFAFGFMFFSCEKNDNDENSLSVPTLNLALEDSNSTLLLDQISVYLDFYSALDELGLLKSASIEDCAVITRSNKLGTHYPVTITIDFGSGCKGFDGKLKAGKVIIVKSAPWKEAGATRTVTFVGHSFEGNKIDGTKTAKNEGVINGKQTFSWNITTTITKADNTVIKRNENRKHEHVAGFDTPLVRTDDIVNISGSSTVVKGDNETYSRKILTPLVKKGDCDFIVSGEVEITRGTAEKITINYGDGTCDNKAVVTKGTEKKEIELKK